jgi:heptosyltransferase II
MDALAKGIPPMKIPRAPESIQTILITRTDRIGDVLLSTPVFETLRAAFPRARICALVLPGTAALLEKNPFIDEIIVYDKRGSEKSFFSSLRFAWRLRTKKIDIAIHLHPTNRVHIISWVAGIPVRIGYKKKCGCLLTHSIADEKSGGMRHEAQYNFDLLSILNVRAPARLCARVFLDAEDEKMFTDKMRSLDVTISEPIILFPGASCPSKRWALERFSMLAARLREYGDPQIVIVGGPDDVYLGQALCEHTHDQELIDLTGKLGLRELACLFKRARLIISNDSGPAHLGASVGAAVLSIFGRNDPGLSPQRWRPLGKRSFYIHKNVGCSLCKAHDCQRGFYCLHAISVQDVLSFIDEKKLLR